jgi:hypothetical protein
MLRCFFYDSLYTYRKFLGHPFIAPADNTIRNVFLNIDTKALDKLFYILFVVIGE